MAGLEVQIGADLSGLEKGIKEAESKIKDLSKIKANKIELGLDTSDINKQISDAKKSLNELKTTLKDTGNSFASATPKIASGGNALMNFSRIAQDAPFGIIGIGNNITATAESFGHLVKETGSAGGALKAVAGSIMGTGGILLAVSLVTTGLTYMAQNGLTVQDVFDKMTGSFNENARALSKINEEAAKNSAGDIASMKALVSAASNVNLSMEERIIAVKKLQNEYPAYFGNLSQEEILNGNVAKSVAAVTSALIAKAKAAAATGKISELAGREEEIRNSISQEILDIAKAYNLSKKEAAAFSDAVSKGADPFKLLEPFKKRAGFFDVAGAIQSTNAIKDLRAELVQNLFLQKKLTDSIEESVAAYLKLEKTITKSGGSAKTTDVSEPIKPINDFKGSFITPGGLADVSGKVVQIAKDVQGAEGVISTSLKNINVAFDMSGVGMMEALQNFNANVNELIQTSFVATFQDLGAVIGDAFANGENALNAAGNSLLASLGGLLSAIGGELIKLGTAAVLAGTVTKLFGTTLGIGAGIAAIAGGTALSAIGSAVSSKANENVQRASMNTGANYSSPASGSSYSSGGSSFNGGNVVFEIEGQKLVGVLSNTLGRNTKLGGSLGI